MKVILRYILTAALLGVIGCASADSEQDRFDRIARDLETGGSSYFIGSSRHAGTAVEKLIKQHERFIWGSSLAPELQFLLQHFTSCSELNARNAGLHEVKGWGGSSKQIPGAKGVLFRNRFRLLLAEKTRGALWNLFSPQNRSLEKYLYNLPADTAYAGALVLEPVMLERLIARDENLYAPAANLCKAFLGMPLKEALSAASGVWKIVVVCDEENDFKTLEGVHIALTLPDHKGKLFKALAAKLKFIPNTVVDLKQGTVKLARLQGKSSVPYIRYSNGALSIYTTPRAAARTTDFQSFPQQPSFIRKLSRYTDLNGVGVFYSRTHISGKYVAESLAPEDKNYNLAVLKRVPQGFLLEDISSCDFNKYAVFYVGLLPLRIAFDHFLNTPPPQAPREKKNAEAPLKVKKAPVRKKPASTVQKQNKSCLGAIEKAGRQILQEKKRSGKWPAQGITGLRDLISRKAVTAAMLRCPAIKHTDSRNNSGLSYANCHYLYFGAPGKDSPKTPLLMEFPFLHKNYIAVFYADGSVTKIQLDGTRSVRRAVSYLHTLHSYEEEEFMRLMQIAAEFDNILER